MTSTRSGSLPSATTTKKTTFPSPKELDQGRVLEKIDPPKHWPRPPKPKKA